MIQPLRRVHRAAFFALAILLPLLLVAGIRARHVWPVSNSERLP